MESVLQDLRYGARALVRTRAFSLVALGTLALGIGANTAIYSVVKAVVLRPLPFPEASRLVFLRENSPVLEGMSVSVPNFHDWRLQATSFEAMGLYRYLDLNLSGVREPERLRASMVSASLFDVLRTPAHIGRTFREEEDRPGGPSVTVLTYGFWQRRLGGDPAISGKTLTLDGQPYTVLGVMPAGFRFPPFSTRLDLWVLGLWKYEDRGDHPRTYAVARLKPGITIEKARADLDVIARRLEAQYPDTNTGSRVWVQWLHDVLIEEVEPAALALMGTVVAVLLLACANVANLLLARGALRKIELAVRAAVGASRARLFRQLLTEAVLLALGGGALGVLVGYAGVRGLIPFIPQDVPRSDEIALDRGVLLFTWVVAAGSALVFGLAPALAGSRARFPEDLKGTSGTRLRGRSILVAAEVALALTLLAGAGLLLRSFAALQSTSPGFEPRNVLTGDVSLAQLERGQRPQFCRELLERLLALPGVRSAALISHLRGGWQMLFEIEGRPRPPAGQELLTDAAVGSPDYFEAMGIPLLKGRVFTEADRADGERVVLIDQWMADSHFPGEDPLGKRIRWPDDREAWWTIVGVVGHVKSYGVSGESRVQVYYAYTQFPPVSFSLVLKAEGDPLALAPTLRAAISEMDPNLPVAQVRTLEEVFGETYATTRAATVLLTFFAALAALVAAVGIYGVLSFAVSHRSREIGIRMALGADRGHVLSLVVGQGFRVTLAGIAGGLLLAFGLTRFLSSLLFGVRPTDIGTFTAVALLLGVSASVASYLPARRASRVDPMAALRRE